MRSSTEGFVTRVVEYLGALVRTGRDRGASAVEYGLMVAAIAAVIVGIVFGLGGIVREVFTDTCTEIATEAATTEACTPAP